MERWRGDGEVKVQQEGRKEEKEKGKKKRVFLGFVLKRMERNQG